MERELKESDAHAFAALFREAYRKCFSIELTVPLTESESHHFSVDIEESTGLEIGWKSLKNYSNYLLGRTGRTENPSVPTLDTLARYVAGAPRTDEERRRVEERHYPYWFRHREELRRATPEQTHSQRDELHAIAEAAPESDSAAPPIPSTRPSTRGVFRAAIALTFASVLVLLLLVAVRRYDRGARFITDEFDDVSAEALTKRGWFIQSIDSAHWAQRGMKPGQLTLFTLNGDNWPQVGHAPVIKNLLVRSSPPDCFVAEVRLTSFFPTENWQQAGILLLADTGFAGPSVRLSIGYNDFSGGFPQTKEIIVQAITSFVPESNKPEEIVHHRLFEVTPATELLVRQHLESPALRIEKRGAHFRFLFSAGPMKNAPFKEVGATDFDFQPAYVAVFALKGFVSQSDDVPVYVDAFRLSPLSCAS